MGENRGAHFNQRATVKAAKPQEILNALNIKKGQTVVDLGSGGGYFTALFSKAVGKNGHVYAVDVDQDLLDYARDHVMAKGCDFNIDFVLAPLTGPKLPKGEIDLIFNRNAFHHIEGHVKFFKKLKPALKPDGRLAIIEYNPSLRVYILLLRNNRNLRINREKMCYPTL